MAQTVYLKPQQVPPELKSVFDQFEPPHLRRKTTQFKVVFSNTFELAGMQWSGGSRNEYIAYNLSTGEAKQVRDPRPWPENQYPLEPFPMKPDWAIVERTFFRGKNMGLTFYLHPDNAPRMLPAPEGDEDELGVNHIIVLMATKSYKNTYAGRTNIRFHEANRETGITQEAWEEAKAELIAKGMLRKNGSITVDGRNAAEPYGLQSLYKFRGKAEPAKRALPRQESRKTFRQMARLIEAMGPHSELIQKLTQVIDTYAEAYAVGGARAGYQALVDAGHSPEAAKQFVKTYEKIKGATKDQVKRDLKAQGMDIDADLGR